MKGASLKDAFARLGYLPAGLWKQDGIIGNTASCARNINYLSHISANLNASIDLDSCLAFGLHLQFCQGHSHVGTDEKGVRLT